MLIYRLSSEPTGEANRPVWTKTNAFRSHLSVEALLDEGVTKITDAVRRVEVVEWSTGENAVAQVYIS